MKAPTTKIMATERVRQRFTEDQIRHCVDRSLFKMSECPEQTETWVSQYRTMYGEIAVVYLRQANTAKVAYKDEVPPSILDGGTHASDYKLTEDEWKRQTQAVWEATGGDLRAPLPRPDHKDVAGLSFVTEDKDLVSANELANDPFFKETERWYRELASRPQRFKVVAVAYHWDAAGDDYYYAGVVANPRSISEFTSICGPLLVEAFKRFVTRFSGRKPTILFSTLWVANDDLENARGLLGSCVGKVMAILAGKDSDYQTMDGMAIFHAVTPTLTETEQLELAKGFGVQGE